MEKILGGGIAATAVAIGVAVAAPAHADDGTIAAINAAAQFSTDVTAAGFYNDNGPKAQLLLGITICNNLDDGYTPVQNATMVSNTGASDMTRTAAGQFVWYATKDLCPWHYGQPANASWPNGSGAMNGGSQTV